MFYYITVVVEAQFIRLTFIKIITSAFLVEKTTIKNAVGTSLFTAGPLSFSS